ncbi:hypothetical protein N2152v2_001483 [Parachlorella kessleri]
MRSYAAVALACLFLCGSLVAAQDAPQCAITQEQASSADYSKLKTACAATVSLDQRCNGCLCAFGEVFAPILAANGIKIDMQNMDQNDVTDAMMACFDVVVPAMEAQGVDLAALAELASCPEIPQCLMAGSD